MAEEGAYLASVDLKEAMKLEVDKNRAEELMKKAKAAVVVHSNRYSSVSSTGKAMSGVTKEMEELIKLLEKNGKKEEQLKAVEKFNSKTYVLACRVSKSSDYMRRWNNESVDVFSALIDACAEYRSIADRFLKIVQRLRKYAHIPTTTAQEAAFVDENVTKHQIIFLHHLY